MAEPLNVGNIQFFPSSNGSLGGVVQSGQIKSQSFNALTNITGATFLDGYANNVVGLGTLEFNATPAIAQVQTIDFTVALEAGDEIFLDIDDASLSQAFVTSNNNTLDLLAAQILLEAGVSACTRTDADTVTVTGLTTGQIVKIDAFAVTGTTPPTISIGLSTGARRLDSMAWIPPGAGVVDGIDVSAGGRFRIPSSLNGSVVVDVVALSLPATNQTDADIQATDLLNQAWDDYDRTDSFEGAIEYRCHYVKNTHSIDTAFNVGIFIDTDAVGADAIGLGIDPASVGDGVTTGVATSIVSDQDPPSAVTFSAPARGGALALGNLAPGQMAAVWIRRTLPPLNTLGTVKDLSILGLFATV